MSDIKNQVVEDTKKRTLSGAGKNDKLEDVTVSESKRVKVNEKDKEKEDKSNNEKKCNDRKTEENNDDNNDNDKDNETETEIEDGTETENETEKENETGNETGAETEAETETQADTAETIEPELESKEEKEKPKFVFGSTTKFGQFGGFKMFGNTQNVFLSEKKEDSSSKESTPSTPGTKIFGSGSTFGNAFQTAINKKSIFDVPTEEKKNNDTNENGQKTKAESEVNENKDKEDENVKLKEKDVYKTVHLEKQDVKSGEENEETLFQVKAKLYHMDLSKVSDGWKEKGFGVIKVNKFLKPPSSYTSRLIMRQDGNLKLILNIPIIKGFSLFRGMSGSLHGNKFIRLQILEDGKPVQYALKIGQVENVQSLYDKIQSQIPK